MKYPVILVALIVIQIIPSLAQEQENPTLALQKIEIPHYEFNKIAREAVVIDLEKPHTISWQILIENQLMYANPDGNAVVRFYDLTIPDKFIEIGMGSPPDEKFWLAVQLPDTGYVVVHSKLERGWVSGSPPTLAYTERSGLTVNNGARIVVSNLDIDIFQIGSYSVHGMESSTDPPSANSGTVNIELISGDPAENPIIIFPFLLAGGVGVLVAILLVTKKRS